MMRRRIALGILSVLAVVAAFALASVGREGDQPLHVAAAADLHLAFTEIGRVFEAETGKKVVFIFGSTGLLTRQIEQGAPVDVFAAADVKFVDKLAGQRLLLAGSEHLYAYGRLALVVNGAGGAGQEFAGKVAGARELASLLNPVVRRVAIASPDHAPYGLAARQALSRSGLWERLQPKLVYARDVRDALQYVQTGNADAAFVAAPLLTGIRGSLRSWLVEGGLYDPPRQTMAVLRGTKQAGASRTFVDFVSGPQGRRILEKYGFRLP